MQDIALRQIANSRGDGYVAAVNYAIVAFVDELLWLPAPAVAAAAIHLLYGPDVRLPGALMAEVGRGAPPSLATHLAGAPALGTVLPSRLGSTAVWRAGAAGLREGRALSRERYRQLQSAFVCGIPAGAPDAASLVREVYGVGGRRSCADGARRLLRRAVRLNRATLALLAAVARGESALRLATRGPLPPRPYDLPEAALDVLAEALPPIVLPDFGALATGLIPGAAAFGGEESIDRYESLFAEMLSRSGHAEVPS